MKQSKRAIGIDESPTRKGNERTVCTTTFRGSETLERVNLEKHRDGEDPTEFIQSNLSHQPTDHIDVLFLDGLALGKFNLFDIYKLNSKLGIPVVTVTENQPNPEKFREAITNSNKNQELFELYDEPSEIKMSEGTVYSHFAGIRESDLKTKVSKYCLNSAKPECLRVADMIASEITPEVL